MTLELFLSLGSLLFVSSLGFGPLDQFIFAVQSSGSKHAADLQISCFFKLAVDSMKNAAGDFACSEESEA